MSTLPYFQIKTDNWLRGNIRKDPLPQQAIFITLIAIVAETKLRNGELRNGNGKPISKSKLCEDIGCSIEELNLTIELGSKDLNEFDHKPRIQILEDGCIFITNFKKMQRIKDPNEIDHLDPDKIRVRELARLNTLTNKYQFVYLNEPYAITNIIKCYNDGFDHGNEQICWCPTCKQGFWKDKNDSVILTNIEHIDYGVCIIECSKCAK
jgi:hypothetical protein